MPEFAKLRKQGNAARARLAERRRAAPRPERKSTIPTTPAATPSSPRRIGGAQKRAGARRLKERIEQMETNLKAMPSTDKRRDRLREDLQVARRLLARIHRSSLIYSGLPNEQMPFYLGR
jgi:hypothetical protein